MLSGRESSLTQGEVRVGSVDNCTMLKHLVVFRQNCKEEGIAAESILKLGSGQEKGKIQ